MSECIAPEVSIGFPSKQSLSEMELGGPRLTVDDEAVDDEAMAIAPHGHST